MDAYDAADRMLTRVADSVTTSYGYDANGNLTSASTSSPARTIGLTYGAILDGGATSEDVDAVVAGPLEICLSYWGTEAGPAIVALAKAHGALRDSLQSMRQVFAPDSVYEALHEVAGTSSEDVRAMRTPVGGAEAFISGLESSSVARIRALRLPSVEHVTLEQFRTSDADWRIALRVSLVSGASDDAAKAVWCAVRNALPDVTESDAVVCDVDDPARFWPMPEDCRSVGPAPPATLRIAGWPRSALTGGQAQA